MVFVFLCLTYFTYSDFEIQCFFLHLQNNSVWQIHLKWLLATEVYLTSWDSCMHTFWVLPWHPVLTREVIFPMASICLGGLSTSSSLERTSVVSPGPNIHSTLHRADTQFMPVKQILFISLSTIPGPELDPQ